METIRNLFSHVRDTIKAAWNNVIRNLGTLLSVCFGGMWFAYLNGFAIPLILIHSWLVSSILTIAFWAFCTVLVSMAALCVGWLLWDLADLTISKFSKPAVVVATN